MNKPHLVTDLIHLFDETFSSTFNTRLIRGDDEPIYLPADQAHSYHRIIFAHGYYSSALHEISHWFIAGEKRRLLEDFGYWYVPDGRNVEQQKQFEQVEVKPQAIEWALSVAANKKFNISADNLNGAEADTEFFKEQVFSQVHEYLKIGFPTRAQRFIKVLADFYHVSLPLTKEQFLSEKEFIEYV